MRTKLFILCGLLVLSGQLLRAEEAQVDGPGFDSIIRAYFWAAGLEGDMGVGNVRVPVDADFSDYAGDLTGALLIGGEVSRGRWRVDFDGVWMQLGTDGPTPGPFFSNIDIQMDTVLFSVAPGYRFIETDRMIADILLGARYVYLRQDLDFTPDFAAVDSISQQVVTETASTLSGIVNGEVQKARDEISDSLRIRDGSVADQIRDAIDGIRLPVDPGDPVDDILGQGGGYDGSPVEDELRRLGEAIKDAVAERAADLVEQLPPGDQRDPVKVGKAIEKAASESIDNLKGNVSSARRQAIENAETALDAKLTSGMEAAASADAAASRDWIDPFIGLRFGCHLSDALVMQIYGDIGGFGVGSELTWQAVAGLGWKVSKNTVLELGYRILDIDYDQDQFIFDMSMSGFATGVRYSF